MINLLATLVIYHNTNYLEYDAIIKQKSPKQEIVYWDTSQLYLCTLVQYLSYPLHPQLCLGLGG